jgi:hypothetical protein
MGRDAFGSVRLRVAPGPQGTRPIERLSRVLYRYVMTAPRKLLTINGQKAGRTVFFVDVCFASDCVTTGRITALVASRFQAKKIIRTIAARCLEFHGSKITPAWQRDLWMSGWKITADRRNAKSRCRTGRVFPV